jgi:hypothetical protein
MAIGTLKVNVDYRITCMLDAYVSIAKSIAWCNGLLLGKSRTILWQLT